VIQQNAVLISEISVDSATVGLAILYAGKRVEDRIWYSSYRGPLLIRAGMKVDEDSLEALRTDIEAVPEPRLPAYRGAIIGTAIVVNCVRPDAVPVGQESWAMGPWCYVLADVRPLEKPLPYKGRLGFLSS